MAPLAVVEASVTKPSGTVESGWARTAALEKLATQSSNASACVSLKVVDVIL
jgi:hypothetical protein